MVDDETGHTSVQTIHVNNTVSFNNQPAPTSQDHDIINQADNIISKYQIDKANCYLCKQGTPHSHAK